MTHNWKIYDLQRSVSDNVVTKITYACESHLSGSNSRKIGQLDISGSASDPDFIPFSDLTQDNVLAWVTGSIDTSSIETLNSASIAQHIEAKEAITEVNGTPWK